MISNGRIFLKELLFFKKRNFNLANRSLYVAGAGTGKTQKILTLAKSEIDAGKKVLVITYTIRNQEELKRRYRENYGTVSRNFVVKGVFSFYLEDLIRPYQRDVFNVQIENIEFTEKNPHLKEKYDGTGERRYYSNVTKKIGTKYNPRYFLTRDLKRAYTFFLAELASIILSNTDKISFKPECLPQKRLESIYSHIFFDEVQDLAEPDYKVLSLLSEYMPNTAITCVGDFRQITYRTVKQKKTKSQSVESEIKRFEELNFVKHNLTGNKRCVQAICDVASEVHLDNGNSDRPSETSEVDEKSIPEDIRKHMGVFVVGKSDLETYILKYKPTVLGWNKGSWDKYKLESSGYYNFGESKGSAFDRVLIIPTENMLEFIFRKNGAGNLPDETKNKLYVAITRARYSVAFVIEDKEKQNARFAIWNA